MASDRFWSEAFRWTITTFVFAFYIASVFFAFEGNYEFLSTFEYWNTVITSTMFAFFLRWLWSFKGLETRLLANTKIIDKEKQKSELISDVINKGLTGKLEEVAIKATLDNKKKSYTKYIDTKVRKYSRKSLIPFRKKLLSKWKYKKDEISNNEFNWDTVKIDHYQYNMDDLMTSYYKQNKSKIDGRSTLNGKVFSSYRTNILTFLFFAIFSGLDIFVSNFEWKDLWVLIGKLAMFMINIYNGFQLGKDFVDSDYNSDLTTDYTFLKKFLDNNI